MEFWKECIGICTGTIHDGITEGSYAQIPEGNRRCILAEVSVKISEGIMVGILEAFLGTKHETITIGTLKDARGRFHKGETPGEAPCGISERIPEEFPNECIKEFLKVSLKNDV